MEQVTFTTQDFQLMLESLIEHQHKLYDLSYLCRDGERREKVIVQIVETEELIKKVQNMAASVGSTGKKERIARKTLLQRND